MQRSPRDDVKDWQQPNATDYGASGSVGSHYNAKGNSRYEQYDEEVYHGEQQSRQSAPHFGSLSPPTSQAPSLPMIRGMRIRGAAVTEYGTRIHGAAGRDQSQNHLSSEHPQNQMHHDPPKPGLSSEISRSSSRARSSSTSEQQSLNPKPTSQRHIMEKKDGQIKEQQKFINRLTSENQSLSANVQSLTEARNRMTQRLKQREKELQQMSYRDPELSRRRDEFFVDQGRQLQDSHHHVKDLLAQIRGLGELPVPPPSENFVPSSSTRDLQGIEESDDDADSEDDLDALDFPDAVGVLAAFPITPVERRIQALGATMDENDWMESQQPVVVSRHIRHSKDNEQSSWYRPIDQTRYWPKAKDDPAFAVVGDGSPVSFEALSQRVQYIASTHGIYGEYQYQPDRRRVDEEFHSRFPERQDHYDRGLSYDQEERLAALGVSGDPKPVNPYTPKNARGRSRSRSPKSRGQWDEGVDYRQRSYESYRPDRQPTWETRDGYRDTDNVASLEASMDPATARTIEAKFGHGQQNQHKQKIKGRKKNKQHNDQQQQNQQAHQQQQQIQQQPTHQHPHQKQYPQDRQNTGRFQGRYDHRRTQTDYRAV